MLKRKVLAALILSSLFSAAIAADAPSAKAVPAKLPAALQNLQSSAGMTVLSSFPAISGLTGWVVRDAKGSDNTVVYTTADGDALLAGLLLDNSGKNMTASYAAEHLPKPDYAPAFKAFSAGGEAAGVTVGAEKAKAEIIVAFDANCSYCHVLHRMLQPSVDAGDLRVRYVPVAILGADSAPKGAGMLATKDATALVSSIARGGNAEYSNDKDLLARVATNTKLMTKHGFNGTPVVLYKSRAGQDETMHIAHGLPAMLGMFKALNIPGHIEQLQADPSLAKFLR